MLKSHFFSIIEQHNIAEDACQRSVLNSSWAIGRTYIHLCKLFGLAMMLVQDV